MEHARKSTGKLRFFTSLWNGIQNFWNTKKGKAILLGAAAVIVAVVVLLVCLLLPGVPTASGNSGLAVQIGSKIYYANANDGYYLYSMNTDGSENQLFLSEPVNDMVTDGSNLYAFINDEYRYVWSIDLNDGTKELVVDTTSGDMEYTNSYLYYTDLNQDRSLYSLYISDTNTSTRLTELSAYDICSDGETVYFRYGRDGGYALCSVPLAGGEVQTILSKRVLDLVYYQDKLYYIDENWNFCSVLPDGSQDTVISEIPCSNPVIFQDAVYFIYNGEMEEEKTGSLCRMNLDGSDFEVLAQGSYSSINAVEGHLFLLNNDRSMYVYDLDQRTMGEV